MLLISYYNVTNELNKKIAVLLISYYTVTNRMI